MMSTSSEVRRDLTDDDKCPICIECVNDRTFLPCLHSFCFQCIQKHYEDKLPGDEVPCAVCRNQFVIPKNGLSGLPKKTNSPTQPDDADDRCEDCSLDRHSGYTIPRATTYCVDCQQKLCDYCSRPHKRMRSGAHQVVPIAMMNRELTQTQGRFCEAHKDQMLRLYCFDCKTNVCPLCFATQHKKHDCDEIEKVAEEFMKQLDADLASVTARIGELEQEARRLGGEKITILTDATTAEQAIKHKAKSVKCIIDAQESELLQELSMVKSQGVKQIEAQKETCDVELISLKSFTSHCMNLKEQARPNDITRSVSDLRVKANQLLEGRATSDKCIAPRISFTSIRDEQSEQWQRSRNFIGQLHVSLDSGDSEIRKNDAAQKSFDQSSVVPYAVSEQSGFKIFDVPNDGDCTVHGIPGQLRRGQRDSKHDVSSLRQDAAEFMNQNQQLFNDTFIADQGLPPGPGIRESAATEQKTEEQVSAKKLIYLIDEPFWEYMKFLDQKSCWGDRLRAAKSQNSSGKLELTGMPDDVASFITHCETGRMLRGVIAKTLPIPRDYTPLTFKKFLDDLSKNKVLVRQTNDSTYWELIGKANDVRELSRLIGSKFPETKTSNAASNSPATPSSPVSSPSPVIASNSFEFKTPGSQIQVSILTGDLLAQSCEVIVCPNNAEMDFSKGGLALIVARKAGPELVEECKAYIKQFQRLDVSDVFDSRPGKIKPLVKRVIHTVGPNRIQHSDKCFELLLDTIFNCFIHADDVINATSIAVPAISSGSFGVPIDVVARAAYCAVVAFDKHMSEKPNIHLRCIKFVNLQSDATASMVKVFKHELASTEPPSTTSAAGGNKLDDTTYKNSNPYVDQSQVASLAGYAALIKVAEQSGLKLFDVPKDGNCAFHAIVDQLRRQGDTKHDAASLRKKAAEFMKQNQQLFNWDTLETASDGDKDTFIANQALPGTWCNEFMLISLSEILHRDIHIHHDNDHVTIITPRTSSAKPLLIGIIEERHYVSLYALETTDSATRTLYLTNHNNRTAAQKADSQ